MQLIKSELINLFKNSVIVATAVANQNATFSEADTKRYVPGATLST